MDPDQLEALVGRLENKLRASWRAAMRGLKDENTLPELERAIASSNTAELIGGIEDAVAHYAADLQAGYVYAGQKAARAVDAAVEGEFRFALADPAAVDWMRTAAQQLAEDLVAEQQVVARMVVRYATQRGLDARSIAEEVQASIGLGPAQVDYVERYRALLEGGDYARARAYELADGRYDAVLDRAAAADAPLGEARIDAMVGRYRDNWVRFRADNIALSASQDATYSGVEEAFQQAIDRGVFAAKDVVRTWISRHDPKVRASHRHLDGETAQLDEKFQGFDGELAFPGDPDAPASETAGCRCVLGFSVIGVSFLERGAQADTDTSALDNVVGKGVGVRQLDRAAA